MAIQSFHEMPETDIPEKAARLVEAYEGAKKRRSLVFEGKSVFELLEEGKEHFGKNPL